MDIPTSRNNLLNEISEAKKAYKALTTRRDELDDERAKLIEEINKVQNRVHTLKEVLDDHLTNDTDITLAKLQHEGKPLLQFSDCGKWIIGEQGRELVIPNTYANGSIPSEVRMRATAVNTISTRIAKL